LRWRATPGRAFAICAARAQVTDTKNFAVARVGLQIAIENFRLKAEAYLGRQRYNQSTT
jgi:hypothetical protein